MVRKQQVDCVPNHSNEIEIPSASNLSTLPKRARSRGPRNLVDKPLSRVNQVAGFLLGQENWVNKLRNLPKSEPPGCDWS